MRVLTVANHLGPRGGLERTQLTNCRTLAARAVQIDLIYVSAGDFEAEWRAFAASTTRIDGTLPRRAAPLRSVAGLAAAVRAGVRLRPDAIYVYRYWDLPYAVTVGALARAPVAFHLCLPPPRTVPRWLAWSLRRVAVTVSVSEDTARRWREWGLDPDRTRIVRTGIDTAEFEPASPGERSAARRDLGVDDSDFLVLYTGRIDREKGVDVLVRACRALAEEQPSLRLAVVGGPSIGSDPADSRRYADELHEAAGDAPVSWLEPRKDVRPLLAAADLAVVPSLWPEPLSRAVMEPLACGVPVLGSDVGGTAEVLTGPLAGFLFPPGDATALAEAIRARMTWRTDDPELGAECRRFAVSNLSLALEVDAIEAALAEMQRPRRPRRTRG
ncbi:MAG TPA: glycosyltransferase family 4 protein [Acidimicrobiales bacterium]|nr:glycosyltransferase family 4 protein [Acidimicrobiales bacterium]